MAILTFQNIMEAEDITEETITVEPWGGDVVVRSVSYRKMGKIKMTIARKRGGGEDVEVLDDDDEVEQALLVAGMVNPTINEEQAALLMEKSASAVMTVLSAIMGRTKTEKDAVKEEEKSLPSGTE